MPKEKNDNAPVLPDTTFPVVGIGGGAGGHDAFNKFIMAIPSQSGMAYILAQHLHPHHESSLPRERQKSTSIPLHEVTENIKVAPNHIYMPAPGKMVVFSEGVLYLNSSPHKNRKKLNLPIDLLFHSLAQAKQSHAIGVMLSGNTSDGSSGLKAIKDHGGLTFAGDESSARFEGMANRDMPAGVVDFVLPPQAIPGKIMEVMQPPGGLAAAQKSKEEFQGVAEDLIPVNQDMIRSDEQVAEARNTNVWKTENRFRTIADFIPQIIWTADAEGNIDYYNRQWYDYTGLQETKDAHQNWITLVHEEDRQNCLSAWRHSIKTVSSFQHEVRFRDINDGKFRWFLAKASPISEREADTITWFGSFTNIHEQKTAAVELLRAKELAELSAKEAAEAARSKQQFLSNMSHEIRTPMNSIIGFTKVLLRSQLTDKQQVYLNAIKTSGDLMVALINDILDLAKVDAGKMIFEQIPFALDETISAILDLFEITLVEKDIELVRAYDTNIPKVISGDPVRLHQVLLNLMSNAIKFTSKGKITMTVKVLSEDAEKVRLMFSLADTGIGIREDKIDLIFDNFQQAHNSGKSSVGGSGLGLSIVKRIVEAQGGAVGVTSKLNEGSVFNFSLDFKKTKEKPMKRVADQLFFASAFADLSVLVVEDAPLNQLLMKTLMTDFGFQSDVVDNGKKAIRKLAQRAAAKDRNYDLIMMDLQMPEMNGFEATAHIRNELGLNTPIVAITADITEEAVEKCMNAGMNDYITKPVDEMLLFQKIVNLLKIPSNPKESTRLASWEEQPRTPVYTNLDYLMKRARGDPGLTREMIGIYLEQTPKLLSVIRESMTKKDWEKLKAATHKIIPSFVIMGFDRRFQEMSKQLQDFEGDPGKEAEMDGILLELESACNGAFRELSEELKKMTNN